MCKNKTGIDNDLEENWEIFDSVGFGEKHRGCSIELREKLRHKSHAGKSW